MFNPNITKISHVTATPQFSAPQPTETSTTTRTATVVAGICLRPPTRPSVPEPTLDEILDSALEELDRENPEAVNASTRELTPASSTSMMSVELTRLPPRPCVKLFEQLPVEAKVNILSYLRLRDMFASIVNSNTRTIFAGPTGIPSAFKEQLEFRKSQSHPLTH